ncbi:unnamed protein product [Phaedon cochleariae]|uniref:Uncharacterized protein n=1 Tax=Phaedon cochleariae TaxID=80249 RepID=A0A9N9X541_PHACE|nr:unnamed protein product [Phaedon cochleariae]
MANIEKYSNHFLGQGSAGRHPTRQVGRHAALRPLSHLPEGVQAEVHAAAARLHPHRVQAVPLPRVRQTVPAAEPSDAAPEDTHQREAVRLRVLRQELQAADYPQPAPEDTHRREALQVRAMRERLPAKGDPRPAHQDPSGRQAVLLPHAQLQKKIRHRARGQEAHRQPHEPTRSKNPKRLDRFRWEVTEQRHAAKRIDPHYYGEARVVLPAVLRAQF